MSNDNTRLEPLVNETIIVLIPKSQNATQITKYRPISLCNTQNKIIAKVIVNRIHPLLSMRISQNQGALVPGRRATDQVFFCERNCSHDVPKS